MSQSTRCEKIALSCRAQRSVCIYLLENKKMQIPRLARNDSAYQSSSRKVAKAKRGAKWNSSLAFANFAYFATWRETVCPPMEYFSGTGEHGKQEMENRGNEAKKCLKTKDITFLSAANDAVLRAIQHKLGTNWGKKSACW